MSKFKKANQSAIQLINEKIDNKRKAMGYLAEDLLLKTIDRDYFDEQMDDLFWQMNELYEIRNILDTDN